MIPADIDPSLRAEPVLETLDDGFSPPPPADEPGHPEAATLPVPSAPAARSPF